MGKPFTDTTNEMDSLKRDNSFESRGQKKTRLKERLKKMWCRHQKYAQGGIAGVFHFNPLAYVKEAFFLHYIRVLHSV